MSLDSDQIADYIHDSAPLLFAVFDREGRIQSANRHTEQLLGGRLTGKTLQDLFVDFGGHLSLEALAATEAPQRLDVSVLGGLPESYFVRVYALDGSYLCIGHPDTDSPKQLAEQVLELNREVGNLARELAKSEATLQHLNDLKNQFLGMAAHDLRGPTGVAMNYAEFILDEAGSSLSNEHVGFLETIILTSQRMHQLVDSFLDLSMIESGNLRLKLQPCDLGDVVHESVRSNERGARQAGITIVEELDDTLPIIEADDGKLIQVLSNVLSNGIKHSPEGSVIRVVGSHNEQTAIVRVIDQGSGIPEELLQTISQPFATSGRSVREERSHGLGLAIAHKVLEAHGGKLEVEQTSTQGTTMLIRVPTRQGDRKEQVDA